DVLPDARFIETHRADAIARRPEMQPAHPTLVEQLPVDPNRTLALQETDRKGHAVLGRDAQAQVDVVGHRMPFQQTDPPLTTKLPQDASDLTPQPSVEDFATVLGYDHHVVLAVPPDMGQVLPLMHRLSLRPSGAFPGGEPMPFGDPRHAGSLEALWVHGQRPWLHVE